MTITIKRNGQKTIYHPRFQQLMSWRVNAYTGRKFHINKDCEVYTKPRKQWDALQYAVDVAATLKNRSAALAFVNAYERAYL
jgi:hypothetical protein